MFVLSGLFLNSSCIFLSLIFKSSDLLFKLLLKRFEGASRNDRIGIANNYSITEGKVATGILAVTLVDGYRERFSIFIKRSNAGIKSFLIDLEGVL